ncbi:MAG: VCBS repeat-containing protein, partial [Bacteroidetes bacterium]|nr:VCBS repeat-containing protein [Bacteroidota bacterium]
MTKLLLPIFIFSFTFTYSQIHFEDISEASGIGEKGPNYGVAFGDYNNDGREDIYVTRIGQSNRLYQNQGNKTFIEVAAQAGVAHEGRTRMAVWGDINNDGWLDLFLANSKGQRDVLYLNHGDGTFEDLSASARMVSGGDGLAAMMGDIDNDGFLDIYVARLGAENSLYRNQGNHTFVDII